MSDVIGKQTCVWGFRQRRVCAFLVPVLFCSGRGVDGEKRGILVFALFILCVLFCLLGSFVLSALFV